MENREFIDRENPQDDNTLGYINPAVSIDLPEFLLYKPPYFPADQIVKAPIQEKARKAPVGSPPTESLVTTVFDARPINARDFIFTESRGELITDGEQIFSFAVPTGFRAILRQFAYNVTITGDNLYNEYGDCRLISNISGARLYTTLLVDSMPVPNYDNLSLPPFNDGTPCYILADEQQTISIKFYLTPGGPFTYKNIDVELYGNLILSSGRPLSFEPGNIPRIEKWPVQTVFKNSESKPIPIKPITRKIRHGRISRR